MQISEQAMWAAGSLLCAAWLMVVIIHDTMLYRRLVDLKVDKDPQVKWFRGVLEWSTTLPILGLGAYCAYRMVACDFINL